MLDFLLVATRSAKRGVVEVYPKFIIKKSKDLMIRGGDFYAIWVEERGFWSTDEQDAVRLIDQELDIFAKEHADAFEGDLRVLHMWDSGSGMIDAWHKYCQRQMRDNYHQLDETLIFSNTAVKKEDYASKKLPYPLKKGAITSYDTLMSALYSPEERQKIEWAIGSIVTGESKKNQKFVVLYGAAGTGKSTVLNIIQLLFDGYCSTFDAKELGSANSAFALESFKTNPLVAIQHDGKLDRIEDNTRINSVVSHEMMEVNEKHKSKYSTRFLSFLFLGTNDPVKITNAKSGLIRRLIDVSPTGNKLPYTEYQRLVKGIEFELGAIAGHCQEVYLAHKADYDNYIPISMMGATNDFYNFMEDSYFVFKKEDGTTLKAAWEMYKTYCDEAKVPHPAPLRIFKEELKNYFDAILTDRKVVNGKRVRTYYSGFKIDKFEQHTEPKKEESMKNWLELNCTTSIFDSQYADCLAQYATSDETPARRWEDVTSRLSDLDTTKLHYVLFQPNSRHIVIDFDLKDENGNKSFERNFAEACKWPATYAELSKSGAGIHLHYIYDGDVEQLERLYDKDIEIKVFTGKSSLRRKLTKCNDISIATLSSGLPLKGEKTVVNSAAVKSEQTLRRLIRENLEKKHHPNTKPSIDFIHKILEDAYNSELHYDVTDMRQAVLNFALRATNSSEYCIGRVSQMKFKSEEPSKAAENGDGPLVFYDVEVFPNLFVVCWKAEGEGKSVVRMINPTPSEIEELMRFRLVGFNCRRYDNHILYGRLIGYTNEQLYKLSQKIIGESEGFFGEAYNVSYADVYDFASKKQSLKKWEIELGIHHKELGLPWDQSVSENLWERVAEYCDNDVIATEATFHARSADFTARKILADLSGLSVNDTNRMHITKILVGNEKHPKHVYTDLATGEQF